MNVTWRGKTYVGTLLDCTRHDWAPPRFVSSYFVSHFATIYSKFSQFSFVFLFFLLLFSAGEN